MSKNLSIALALALGMTVGMPTVASAQYGPQQHYGMQQQQWAPPAACQPACRPAPRPVCQPVCRPACDPCDPCRRSGLLGLGILGIL